MKNTLVLNQKNLVEIENRIPVPTYDRNVIKTGIVHIGVGGFHRAHQAFYTHKLLEQSNSEKWGICGVGLREGDTKMHEVFKQQDNLYTLLVKHPNGKTEPQIIGCG